ncbi:MAG: Lrp/AsnC family transcriptional regulator [Acidimicrobiia bacterium]
MASSAGPPDPAAVGRTARPLDAIDRRLVAELRRDGRISVTDLSQRVGISRANAYSRFERLRDDGVIEGFGARVDASRLGLTIAALVTVTAEQHRWRELRDEMLAMPEVDYFALTTGEFDMVLLVRAPDVETLRDVVLVRLQNMPEIRATRTILVLDEVVPARSFLR